MGMSVVSNQFFLEASFITLYNDVFRNWEFNIGAIYVKILLYFLRTELDCSTMYLVSGYTKYQICGQKYNGKSNFLKNHEKFQKSKIIKKLQKS